MDERVKVLKTSSGGYMLRFTGPDGRRRTLRVGQYVTPARSMAAKLEAVLAHREAGEPISGELAEWLDSLPPQRRKKLSQWGVLDRHRIAADDPIGPHVEAWVESLRLPSKRCPEGRSEARIKDARRRAWNLLDAAGVECVGDLSAERIEDGVATMQERGFASVTIATSQQAVKQFASYLAKEGVLRTSPLSDLELIDAQTKLERRAMTPDEQRRLVQAARTGGRWRDTGGDERALIYRVVLQTGLRRNEVRSLTAGAFKVWDVNPTLQVRSSTTKNRKPYTFVLREETAALLREHLRDKSPAALAFQMPEHAADMLRHDLAAARQAWLDEAADDPDEQRRRLEADYLVSKASDGSVADFHSLRVSFISNLARAGVPVHTTQRLARHATVEQTMRTYAKVRGDDYANALDMLPPLDMGDDLPGFEKAVATGTDGDAGRYERATETAHSGEAKVPLSSSSCIAAADAESLEAVGASEVMGNEGETCGNDGNLALADRVHTKSRAGENK